MMYHDAMLQESNENCSIITDSLELLTKNEFSENEVEDFAQKAAHLLDNCSIELGAGTPFRYSIGEHLGRVRLRIILRQPVKTPLLEENDPVYSVSEYVTQLFLRDNSAFVSHRKIQNWVIITLYSAVKPRKKFSIKS